MRELARVSRVSPSFVSEIEAGDTPCSMETLNRLSIALGADLSVRLYPNTGPAIRDRHQARMVEGLLRALHPRWKASLEVAVHRPARGVIDVVLHDAAADVVVCVESESDLRRVEQQLRWSQDKAESLSSSSLWPTLSLGAETAVSRLLLLRSTERTRRIVRDYRHIFEVAYPADPSDVRAALLSGDAPWPGPGLVWMTVDGPGARLLMRRPPGFADR